MAKYIIHGGKCIGEKAVSTIEKKDKQEKEKKQKNDREQKAG